MACPLAEARAAVRWPLLLENVMRELQRVSYLSIRLSITALSEPTLVDPFDYRPLTAEWSASNHRTAWSPDGGL